MTGASLPGSPAAAAGPRRIPDATVARLPTYQRILRDLLTFGTTTISSDQLAERAGVNASKVRKDFSFLGSFGTRGSGYEVRYLLAQIDRELGLDQDWPVVVVGLGNLGRALANFPGFTSRGFRIAGLFDVSPSLVGSKIGDVEIRHLDRFEEMIEETAPAIGVIATPSIDAQAVADRMVRGGVQSILNFAPRVIRVPPAVLLRHVDLSNELQVLTFHLSHRDIPLPSTSPVSVSLGLSEVETA